MTIQTDIQSTTRGSAFDAMKSKLHAAEAEVHHNREIAKDIIESIFVHGSVQPMFDDIVEFQRGYGLYMPLMKLLNCTEDEVFGFIYTTVTELEYQWAIEEAEAAADYVAQGNPFSTFGSNIATDPLTGLKYDKLTCLTLS